MDRSRIRLLGLLRLVRGSQWAIIAREAQLASGVERLMDGRFSENSSEAREVAAVLHSRGRQLSAAEEEAEAITRQAAEDGLQLTTVLDRSYPENLRTIRQLPPFLFYRGRLEASDRAAVSVVGTRNPSADGTRRAASVAAMLAHSHVVVVSGLARGIDTAAHEAALAAGGRTIAVLGSGLHHMYPRENAGLADRIAGHGAVVSQFWPETPPTRATFPIRNAVSSGLSLGTVVVEASSTSGAKMQARLALEQGRAVFLPQSLIDTQDWARAFVLRGAIPVPTIPDLELFLSRRLQANPVDDTRLFAVG